MGTYLNPGNKGFQEMLQSGYVDKTGLIAAINIGASQGAISQIKDRNYPAVLAEFGGEIVLAGINYDAKKKAHGCVIDSRPV